MSETGTKAGSGAFAGKVVLISGIGGGQGRAAARAFAKEGARVVGCDLVADASRRTTEMVRDEGGEMISVEPLDLAEPADADRWVKAAIDAWGRIDVLYNNAGTPGIAPFDAATIDHWDFTIRNELTLSYVAARAVWPHMVSGGGGVIVNVASAAGHRELASFPAVGHGAANAGIHAMTRMLAAAGAQHGIRSVSLSPGFVNNPNAPAPYNDPQSPEMQMMVGPVNLGRPAEIDEVINTALFLASDKASYITGTDIAVDGGMTGITLF